MMNVGLLYDPHKKHTIYLSGFDPKAADVGPTQNDGFKGDIESIRQGIADMKDPKARAEAMAAEQRRKYQARLKAVR